MKIPTSNVNWLLFLFFSVFQLEEVSIEGINFCFIFLFGSSGFRGAGKKLKPNGSCCPCDVSAVADRRVPGIYGGGGSRSRLEFKFGSEDHVMRVRMPWSALDSLG